MSADKTMISVAMSAKTSGWVAWGISPSGSPGMVGTEAVIGHTSSGDANVYKLGAYDTSQFSLIGAVIPLTNVSACTYSDNGATWTVAKFARSTATGQNPISLTKPTSIAIAFGSSTTLSQHSSSNRATLSMDFSTNTIVPDSKTPAATKYKIAHGSLMFIGFSVFLPIGLFLARYGQLSIGEIWFVAHILTQLVGYFTAFAGFVIALWMVHGAHFKTKAHSQLGVSIIVAAVVQIAIGFFRPHKAPDGEKITTARKIWFWIHRILGFVIIIIAVITVFFGLHQYGGIHYGWYIGYAVYVGLWIILALALQIRQAFFRRKPESISSPTDDL